MFFHGDRDFITLGKCQDFHFHSVSIYVKPARNRFSLMEIDDRLHFLVFSGFIIKGKNISYINQLRGDIDLSIVDPIMSVSDELTSMGP